MKHMKIFGTLTEMLAFLATNPTYGVIAMNNETNHFVVIGSSKSSTDIPNDEIWYTTTNDEAMPLDDTNLYYYQNTFNNTNDSEIVSNVYKNGKGVLKFNCSVTNIGGLDDSSLDYTPLFLNLKTIILPNSVTTISSYAFAWCNELTSITIPNSVTSIGELAFTGCAGLTNITIPDSMTIIGGGAFYDCVGLTSITIPNNVTTIYDYVFYNCNSLIDITLSSNLTDIGNYTFSGCSNLNKIICNATTAPYVSDIDHYDLFSNVKEGGKLILPDDAKQYSSWMHLLDKRKWNCFGGFNIFTKYMFTQYDNNRNIIGGYDLYNNLDGMYINGIEFDINDLVIIGSESGSGSGSKSGSGAGSGSGDQYIALPPEYESATETYIIEFVLKSYPTNISGKGWFAHSIDIKSINIPNSVSSIDDAAFENCYQIENICYNGTQAQWQEVTKSEYWYSGIDRTSIVHCSDSDVTI